MPARLDRRRSCRRRRRASAEPAGERVSAEGQPGSDEVLPVRERGVGQLADVGADDDRRQPEICGGAAGAGRPRARSPPRSWHRLEPDGVHRCVGPQAVAVAAAANTNRRRARGTRPRLRLAASARPRRGGDRARCACPGATGRSTLQRLERIEEARRDRAANLEVLAAAHRQRQRDRGKAASRRPTGSGGRPGRPGSSTSPPRPAQPARGASTCPSRPSTATGPTITLRLPPARRRSPRRVRAGTRRRSGRGRAPARRARDQRGAARRPRAQAKVRTPRSRSAKRSL